MKIKIAGGLIKPEEIPGEEAFFKKVNILAYENYGENILKDLADKDYKLNRKDLYDENNLTVLTIQEQVYTFISSLIRIYEEKSD